MIDYMTIANFLADYFDDFRDDYCDGDDAYAEEQIGMLRKMANEN